MTRSVALLCCSAFIPGFHLPPVSLSVALSLQGTVLLPFRGQSSLHCWRQVAKDTSTRRQSLNVIRWRDEWREGRGAVALVGSGQWAARQHPCAAQRTQNIPCCWPHGACPWWTGSAHTGSLCRGLSICSLHARVSGVVFMFCAAAHLSGSALNGGPLICTARVYVKPDSARVPQDNDPIAP